MRTGASLKIGIKKPDFCPEQTPHFTARSLHSPTASPWCPLELIVLIAICKILRH